MHKYRSAPFTEQQWEALDILQEECAEIIQQISKVKRADPDFKCRGGPWNSMQLLKQEILDFMIVHSIASDLGVFEEDLAGTWEHTYATEKLERLKQWSTIVS